MKTIFFSWQSDVKPVRNKFHSALDTVVKQLGDQLEEAKRPELDSDTQGTYGSEEILTTIFSKIDASSIFIADVTPIISTDQKMIPNPNVMVEVGYALKAKGPNSRLYVFCVDGVDSIDIEKMPFDIRGKKLFGFNTSDTPSFIAAKLKPMIAGMLQQQDPSEYEDGPYVYVNGASFTNWSDGQTVSMNIWNSEDKEYQLDAIEIEGKSAEPFRGLKPNTTTQGITVMGVTQIFQSSEPLIKMTVSRGAKKYHIEQKILAPKGADGQYHFAKFIESSIAVAI